MTYILDMAGGTEYQGDEMSCPSPSATSKPEVPGAYHNQQVELRLAMVETTPDRQERDLVQGLDLSALINAIED